ncbi:S1C family serine protease [Anoxynatronum buryatiense]|uniref:Trypsin-like peptidase domain-containing protein n=1 Tax=Anoxynatronum buryatiense TaxID=489973 RepID=A0AA45WXQ2_9CLOT|nr:serine protease [Anoxynatronum buryatiense]SMP64829.1 Trypsin-like peptidase domain-containing protein [Anoxynatronum buryatiense]
MPAKKTGQPKEAPASKTKTVSKSLAITMIAGFTFMLLFVYGTAGFLLFQYFRENPASAPSVAESPGQGTESSFDSMISLDESEGEDVPPPVESEEVPLLAQPPMQMTAAYLRLEEPLEKSMEQIAALKKSVVLLEAGESQGSGVVISGQGHVITNFHVIEDSPYLVKATLDADTGVAGQWELMLLGYDRSKDLALLQFKRSRDLSLQPIPLGSIDTVSAGQRIVTIGSPRGLMNTISDGIVSGIRQFDSTTYLQISAPISPGNSGGALLNMKGELLGLTTFKVTESENLNFAISADEVKALIDANPHWVNP